MVKSYLKYELSKTFGLITSATANVIWTAGDRGSSSASRAASVGKAVTAAGEEVLCWDIKKGELLSRWRDHACNSQVTALARSCTDTDVFAAGYEDGSIRLWDSRLATVIIRFNGHKSAVSFLAFDPSGTSLASGSQDTDLIIWDLVSETGLYKLRGHTNQITGLHFLSTSPQAELHDGENGSRDAVNEDQLNSHHLVTTSKDGLIKLWDLRTQHCIETHVAQGGGECWSLSVSPSGDGCITAGNDGELRFWMIDTQGLANAGGVAGEPTENYLLDRGSVFRQAKDRTVAVSFHPRLNYLATHGSEKYIEVFKIRSESEVQKSLARKRRRKREKAARQADKGIANGEDAEAVEVDDPSKAEVGEFVVSHLTLRTPGKVRAFDWAAMNHSKSLGLLVSLVNNQLEIYNVDLKQKDESSKTSDAPEYTLSHTVDMPGHRTDVRSLSLSSDDRMLASASNGALKVWNIRSQSCIRTLDCGYALCSAFLPGDKIVAVGSRNGDIELFDISSSSLLDTVKAHEGPIWTLHVHPDGRSMVTGSADKTTKFWNFTVEQEEVPGSRRTTPRFKIVHKRTLQVSDDVLCTRFSPDGRLLAVALLDNTVKVFFADSLKLFLNLYGHKLPVLSMDISFDSKLIVTCSADKNVRLWGLDFGDCHKAFFAHQDSIMQVAFVPHNQEDNGHHFFSASKDKTVKYWDGDKFEQIQKLQGHHGEIWAMAVSRTGEFVVSASHDKSIRIWNQTDEPIFLEEEREKELEELYESTLTANLGDDDDAEEAKAEAVAAGKQTTETLMAGERIAEALDIGLQDLKLMKEWRVKKEIQPSLAPPQRNIIFSALGDVSAEAHVLSTIEKINAAALQDALLVLHFDMVTALLTFLDIWAQRRWNIPLTCRVLFFLVKTHHKQIVASRTMRPVLDDIRVGLRSALQGQKDEMGFNMAAIRVVAGRVRESGMKQYVDEALWDDQQDPATARKKRTFVNVA